MDPKLIAEQKTRLSKHNFLLGLSPPVYTSTNVAVHALKSTNQQYDKIFRLKALGKNIKTNFVDEQGFEKTIRDDRNLGPLPLKGELDKKEAN